MSTLSLVLLSLLAPAHAQELAPAADAWLTADAPLLRWPDAEVVVSQLTAGTQVELLVEQDGRWRVRKGADFGWIPVASLTAVDPAPPAVDGGGMMIPLTLPTGG
jgi:hypothetical protein